MADNQELISEYIDLSAVTSQTDAFLGQIKRLDDAYTSLSSKSVNLGGLTSTKDIVDQIKTLQKAYDDIGKQKQQLLDIDLKAQKVATESARTKQQEAKATAEQAKAEATVATAKNKTATASQQLAKASIAEKKAVDDLFNDYKQLSLAYADAALKAKNLALQQGANTPAAKTAIADAAALKAKLDEVDQATGNYTRNVGNYGGAFTKFYGLVRQAANILPGIGISGIFLGLFEGIKAAAEGLGLFTASEDKAVDEQKKFAESTKKLNDSLIDLHDSETQAAAGQAGNIAIVKDLAAAVLNGNLSYKERQRALDELKETNKAYFGDLTLETATYDKLTKLVNEYAKAIINQAVVKEFSEDIAKTAKAISDALDLSEKQRTKLTQATVAQAKAEEVLRAAQLKQGTDAGDAIATRALVARDAATKKVTEAQKELDEVLSASDKLQFQRATAEQKLNAALLEGYKIKKLGSGSQGKADKLNAIEQVFDPNDLKVAQEYYKQLSELDASFLASRLANRATSLDFEKQIITGEQNTAIANEKAKAAAVVAEKTSSANDIANAENAANKKIEEINIAAKGKLLEAEKKFNADVLAIEISSVKRKADQEKADRQLFIDQVDSDYKVQQSRLATNRDNALATLESNRKFDKDGERRYQQEKLQIEIDYLTASLQLNITHHEAIAKLSSLTPEEKAKFEADIAALKRQIAELQSQGGKIKIKVDTADLTKLKKALEEITDLAKRTFDVIGSAIDANITAKKNALQEQSDLIDKNSAKEIEAINSSTASEQDKAAKIAIVNAHVAAQKAEIDRKQRVADQERARFERAANIANIITATALAVVKALPNIPLAIAVGVLGAAQLAIAIAAPIPKYKHGTKNHPGGLAVVGDGGKEEVVLLPGGSSFITPSRDTLVDLPKGAQVFPDMQHVSERIMQMSMRPLIPMPASKQFTKEDLAGIMSKEISRVIGMYKNRPVEVTRLKHGELRKFVQNGTSWTEYVNKNV